MIPLVIRADASATIGVGHVIRCLSLAHAAVEHGLQPVFVSRGLGGVAAERVRAAGFRVVELADGIAPREDAVATSVAGGGRAVVVVDHYGLGAEWWEFVAHRHPLAAVDDIGRSDLGRHCHLVLNQNVAASADWYDGDTELLLGCAYAMLRPPYVEARRSLSREHPDVVRNLLLTMGGADPFGITGRLVGALREVAPDTRLTVVQGPAVRPEDSPAQAVADDPRAELLVAPSDLVAPMLAADLALTAGGSTCYELAALGLPAATLELAQNQAGICRGMAEAGASVFLGERSEVTDAELAARVDELVHDRDWRQRASAAGLALVDGRGAERVAGRLRALAN